MIFALFCAFSAPGQNKHKRYLDYIDRYKTVALEHERTFGVPASITLAQGILESSVGQSKMAREANNHFGIKAYHWKGEVYGRCDSTGTVGYRKYGAPEDSFLDHAQFLKTARYKVLYEFDVTDYRSWAQGLRDCGYAQDKDYPDKLIAIIEQYELYALDGGHRLDGPKPVTQAQVEQDSDEPSSSRWYHRKPRNRGNRDNRDNQQQVENEQQQAQLSIAPTRQGHVSSSADND